MRARRTLVAVAIAALLAGMSVSAPSQAATNAPRATLGPVTLTPTGPTPTVLPSLAVGDQVTFQATDDSIFIYYDQVDAAHPTPAKFTMDSQDCDPFHSELCPVPQGTTKTIVVQRTGLVTVFQDNTYWSVNLQSTLPAPTGVSAAAGNASATVSWTAPVDTSGWPVTAYTVTSTPGGKTCSTTGATSCSVGSLTNGTAYTFVVTATNAVGTSAPSSASAPATPSATLPTPTVKATLDAATRTVTLAWGPYDWQGLTPKDFTIERQALPNGRVTTFTKPSTQTSLTDPDLGVGKTYEYRVRANAQDGTVSAWGSASATVANPGIPITAKVGDGSAVLTWTPVPGAEAYLVDWFDAFTGQGGGNATVTSCATECRQSATGLVNSSKYLAIVYARSKTGSYIAFTEPPSAFTPTIPVPDAPKVSVTMSGTLAQFDWAPYSWGSFTPGSFEVEWSSDAGTTWRPQPYRPDPLATNGDVGGLTPGTTVRGRVRAVTSGGAASAWGTASALVPTPAEAFTLAAVGGDQTISGSFTTASGADNYIVFLRAPGQPTLQIESTCSAKPCPFTFTGLANGVSYNIIVEALKGMAYVTDSNRVYVTPTAPPQPLNAYYPTELDLRVGRAIAFTPTVSGGTAPFRFSSGSTPLPVGLSLDPATGAISGVPRQPADGLFPVVVRDAANQSLTVPVRIRIAPHDFSLSYGDYAGHVGAPVTITPHTSLAIGPVRDYAVSAGTLPAGLRLDAATGVIAGSPTRATAGPVSVTITARDDLGVSSASFTLSVDSGPAALSASYPNVVAHVGKGQTVTPTVSGASGALGFRVVAGQVPDGMTLNATTGVVSGTPTAAQSAAPVTVRVTDSATSVDVTFSIEVLAHTLTLAYPSVTSDVGAVTTLTPAVSHIEGSISYAVTSGALPAGLALNATTGVITGTPTQATSGPVALQVTGTDSYGASVAAFTIAVTAPAPVVPTLSASLTRDVEELSALGAVIGAAPGAKVTPMIKLSSQSSFSAGVPVTIGADGSFTWSRLVAADKVAQVYFTVGAGRSATLRVDAPEVTASASRTKTQVVVRGATVNISAGSDVVPWFKINGGRAIRGETLTVGSDGTFVWKRAVSASDSITVKFNVRGVVSRVVTV
ncbi:MAG: putative Ig domain-containing protein [Actinomycetota bacterium]